ncbi:MAG: M56 family metallopeptidase, partial [Clostridia bacterium]|nr:M56 family metallopeptidase [Clostridia bacterium]
MKEIFISFLNVGINGSILIAAVILTRLIFKKYNRSIICLLWGLVALRMLIPLNIPAEFSLLPRAQSVTVEKAETDTPVTDTQPDKAPVADNGINVGGNNRVPITDTDINAGGNNGAPVTEGAVGGDVQPPVSVTPDEGVPEVPPVSNVATSNEVDTAEAHPDVKDIFIRYGTVVWLVGIACMVIYYVICDIRLRIKTRVRYEKEKGVYLCDDVKSPFVMGVIRPRIMLPSSTDEENEQYILLHERAHIERGDHIWKVLAFAVLALHWYNPFVWLSFMLYSRDTELACDERVIRKNGSEIRKPYAHALLTYSMGKGGYVRGGWSFSQRSLTARIKGVLNYKKPALWVFVSFGLACIVLAVCFMTVPVEGEDGDGGDTQVSATEGTTETETAESTEPTENTEVTENTEPTENTETTDSTEPEPTEPEPTEPESTEPEPTESEPTEPEPTEPEPTEPEPTESDPTEPKPTESESTEPEPTEPEPTEPEPTEPEPTEPKPDEKEPTTVFNTMARDSF